MIQFVCNKCGILKPSTGFNKNKTDKKGFISTCKECRKLAYDTPEAKIKKREYQISRRLKLQEDIANDIQHESAIHDTFTCSKCKLCKTKDDFHVSRSSYKGRFSQCKECVLRDRKTPEGETKRKAQLKAYRDNTKEIPERAEKHKRATKSSGFYVNYGIDIKIYETMLDTQKSKCALCDIHMELSYRGLVVDHCHTTGRVRGLLCNKCNLGIGHLQDDTSIIEKALVYLKSDLDWRRLKS